jgi:hypothetical protein
VALGGLGEHPSLNKKILEKHWDCDEDEKKLIEDDKHGENNNKMMGSQGMAKMKGMLIWMPWMMW